MFLTIFFLTYGEFCPKLVKIRSLSNFPENSTDLQTLFISPKTHFLWMKSTEVDSMVKLSSSISSSTVGKLLEFSLPEKIRTGSVGNVLDYWLTEKTIGESPNL